MLYTPPVDHCNKMVSKLWQVHFCQSARKGKEITRFEVLRTGVTLHASVLPEKKEGVHGVRSLHYQLIRSLSQVPVDLQKIV